MVRHRACLHYGSYEPKSILDLVAPGADPLTIEVDGVETKVNMKSLRLQCFKRSVVCVKCGRIGTIMSLDKFRAVSKIPSAHFGLYAVEEGRFILMTKDHITPVSKGGKKTFIDNVQTMCDPCNGKKGNRVESE